jgi:hypothetical protein
MEPESVLNMMKDWGVGPAVAAALADVFGGHVLTLECALQELAKRQWRYSMARSFPGQTLALPGEFFFYHPNGKAFFCGVASGGMVAVERSTNGFINASNCLAITGSICGGGDMVNFSGRELDRDMSNTLCVPLTQFMRTAIAMHL